jgi:LysR family hydrogen peroxide-inducible transcriptional activator
VDIKQLRYFILAAEEKSFARASEKAFLSEQTIGKAVQSLERELNVSLFVRLKTGLELTLYGSMLYERAVSIVSQVDETTAMLTSENAAACTIKFGVAKSVLEELNPNKLFEFQMAHPNWNLKIFELNDRTIEYNVYRETIDVGGVTAKSNSTYFDYYALKQHKTYVAMNKDNPLSNRDELSLKDLQYEKFIIGSSDYNSRGILVEALRNVGVVPDICYEMQNINWAEQLLELNKGVFLCPDIMPRLNESPNICYVPLKDDPHIFSPQIIVKKDHTLLFAAEKLLNDLVPSSST